MTGESRKWGLPTALPWIIVLVAIIVGYLPMLPPAVANATSASSSFSAERAGEHVSVIAARPHPLGSTAISEVRSYLENELSALDIEFTTQTIARPNPFVPNQTAQIVNVIARLPGDDSTGAIAFIAHYDTVPETPGANDNTAAVATLLEVGRALQAEAPQRNDVYLLFTDSEEPSQRYGSTAFVAEHPAFDEIALAVNLEATGHAGASLLVEVSGPERWLVSELDSSGAHPVAFSFATETTRWIGDIGTDFDIFRNEGVPGFHFVYQHGSSIYHLPADNVAALGARSMQHHGSQSLAVARHFGNLDLGGPIPSGGAVFFVAFGQLVLYPTSLAIPLLALALAVLLPGMLRRRPSPGRLGVGFGITFAVLALATLAWFAITSLRSTLGLVEGYVYFSAISVLAAVSIARANRRLRPEDEPEGFGVWAALVVLAALTALFARGFSYLFAWPLLAVGIAVWIPGHAHWQRLARFTLAAVVTIVLLVPAADTFLQFAHPRPGNPDSNLPAASLIPFGLTLLAIGVARSFWPSAAGRENR